MCNSSDWIQKATATMHQQLLLRLRRILQLLRECLGPLAGFCPPRCVLDLLPLAAALSRLPSQLVL